MGMPFICRVWFGIGRRPAFLTGILATVLAGTPPPAPAAAPFGDRLENGRVMAFASTDLAPGRLGAAVVCLDGEAYVPKHPLHAVYLWVGYVPHPYGGDLDETILF